MSAKYAKLEIVEIVTAGAAEETQKIRKHLSPSHIKIYCDIYGEKMSSEAFAEFIETTSINRGSRFDIVIGGAYGILPESKKLFDKCISFSDMTFGHKIFRAVVLEQLYRAMTILAGHPYHHN